MHQCVGLDGNGADLGWWRRLLQVEECFDAGVTGSEVGDVYATSTGISRLLEVKHLYSVTNFPSNTSLTASEVKGSRDSTRLPCTLRPLQVLRQSKFCRPYEYTTAL